MLSGDSSLGLEALIISGALLWRCYQATNQSALEDELASLPSDLLMTVEEEWLNVKQQIRSENGEKISLEFRNNTAFTIDFYWINYAGEASLRFSVSPGKSAGQNTYATHPWLLKTQATGEFIALFVPHSLNQAHIVTIKEGSAIEKFVIESNSRKQSNIFGTHWQLVDALPECNFSYKRVQICQFDVFLEEGLTDNLELLQALYEDLQYVRSSFPVPAMKVIDGNLGKLTKGPTLYVNSSLKIYDEITKGKYHCKEGRHCCFHPSAKWLEEHGNSGEKVNAVEIYAYEDYLNVRKTTQPQVLLHEFSHMFHFRISFDNVIIKSVFEDVVEVDGLYLAVQYMDHKDKVKAYAATNVMEYFASISVAFFGKNDYFPFCREELKEYDNRGSAMLEKIWHLSLDELSDLVNLAIESQSKTENEIVLDHHT